MYCRNSPFACLFIDGRGCLFGWGNFVLVWFVFGYYIGFFDFDIDFDLFIIVIAVIGLNYIFLLGFICMYSFGELITLFV